MPLPSNGQISMADINLVLFKLTNSTISLNDTDVRQLAKIPSGTISLRNFYGASNGGTDTGALPTTPMACDYYFANRNDFDQRKNTILAENRNDLSQKTFGFGDAVTSLSDGFANTTITKTPKLILGSYITDLSYCFSNCLNLTTVVSTVFNGISQVTDVRATFYNCENVTSELPAVWDKSKFPCVNNGMYYGMYCNQAANYNSIPVGYK